MRRKLVGCTNSVEGESLESLFIILWSQGRRDQVEALYREELALRRKALGDHHPAVAALLWRLEPCLTRALKNGESGALDLFREASEHADSSTLSGMAWAMATGLHPADREGAAAVLLAEKAVALTSRANASCLDTLAAAYAEAGQFTNAVKVQKEAIALTTNERKKKQYASRLRLYECGIPYHDWGELSKRVHALLDEGKVAEAKSVYHEFADRWGDEPHVLNNLVWVLATAGPSKLRDGVRDLLCLWAEKAVALTSRTNANYLDTLAAAYAGAGQFTNAVKVQKEAIALPATERKKKEYAARLRLYESGIPYHDPGGLAQQAHDLVRAGKFAEAEAVWREELVMEKARSGEEHPEVANSLVNLAGVLERQGKFTEAEQQYREELAIRRKLLDSEDPALAAVLARLTHFLLAQNKFTEAEPLARECLALRERLMPDDWLTFNARSLLGASLLGQKKYAEAEPLLLSGYDGIKQREASIPAEARTLRRSEALQRLVELYEATGRPAQAAEWKQKLAEFQQPQSETNSAAPPP